TTFRPDYLELKESIAWMAFQNHRPVIAAFTATAPPDHRREIAKLLGMKKPNHFVMSLYRKNITLLNEDCSGLKVKQRLKRTRRSEEHTSELQSRFDLVCRLLLE